MTDDGRRVAAVTGGTGAIGEAIARGIAKDLKYEVILVCRNASKAERACSNISAVTGNPRVRYEVVDLSRRSSIQSLGERWLGPLHVLVNNAADTPRDRQLTTEGLEVQFATNIMGYFWMIQELTDVLARCSPSRVVNVASYWAGGLDLDDLQFERRRYNNDDAYRQSKQADRMLTVAIAEQLRSRGIAVNACHPGDVKSALSSSLGFGGHQSPDEAAAIPVWLATDSEGQHHSGRYFENQRLQSCQFSADREAVEALYQTCRGFAT
ncbi:SDR family NAD(P)-dependent oxidoreductase [Gammaproteobacteria bacterium]|nr:SDR family NAD(P)-dependent oxidoreductase [Gammaproteobacteria bacterium]